MGVLDIIIAIIVLVGLWRGYRTGFIRTFIGLVGWFIALVAATRLADDVAPQMAGLVASPVLQTALGFLTVVLVIMVFIQFVGYIAAQTIDVLKLSWLDKFTGGILGAIKNVLVVLIIFSFTSPLLVSMPMWQNSTLAPELLPFAPHAQKFASDVLGDAWYELNQP